MSFQLGQGRIIQNDLPRYPGVGQTAGRFRLFLDRCQRCWPFAAVAVHIRQRQVRQMSLAAVLLRQDMVHRKKPTYCAAGM
jgi:hypothetical protein